jgi:nitrogen fixation NifU-like protein
MNTRTDLQNVYRATVLEHSRHPHNYHLLQTANRKALGFNPLCGDKLTVYVNVQNDQVLQMSFEGSGCAISIASASMMTDALEGCSVTEADAMINQVQHMLASDDSATDDRLAEIRALEGVRSYPSRVKCATLAWTAMAAALHGDTNEVSTEK